MHLWWISSSSVALPTGTRHIGNAILIPLRSARGKVPPENIHALHSQQEGYCIAHRKPSQLQTGRISSCPRNQNSHSELPARKIVRLHKTRCPGEQNGTPIWRIRTDLGKKRKGKGKGTKSHTSAHADTNHYVGREAAACEVGANIVDQRVAANCNIFLNMIHEGLVYLGAIQQGQIVLNNADSPVITLRSSPKAIATMFYGNDVLVFFHAILFNVLRTPDIMRAYKLNENLDYSHLWSVGTPGVLSGETALVAQTAILPRTLGTADLAGDLESEGMRTVTATRARLLLSFHQIEECFRQGNVPNVWQAYYRHVFENTFEDCIVENLNYNWGDRQLAPMNSILIPSCNEQHAFTVLKMK